MTEGIKSNSSWMELKAERGETEKGGLSIGQLPLISQGWQADAKGTIRQADRNR